MHVSSSHLPAVMILTACTPCPPSQPLCDASNGDVHVQLEGLGLKAPRKSLRQALWPGAQIFRYSVWVGRPTPGSALMNLRYRDESKVAAAHRCVHAASQPAAPDALRVPGPLVSFCFALYPALRARMGQTRAVLQPCKRALWVEGAGFMVVRVEAFEP